MYVICGYSIFLRKLIMNILQGDWVWLKKFETGQFKEVKQSTTKIFTKVSKTLPGQLFMLVTKLYKVFIFVSSLDERSQE